MGRVQWKNGYLPVLLVVEYYILWRQIRFPNLLLKKRQRAGAILHIVYILNAMQKKFQNYIVPGLDSNLDYNGKT